MMIFKDKQVKVNKDHKCCWCGEVISRRELAQYRSYIFENTFRSEHLHPECYDALNRSDIDEEGYSEYMFKRGTIEEK